MNTCSPQVCALRSGFSRRQGEAVVTTPSGEPRLREADTAGQRVPGRRQEGVSAASPRWRVRAAARSTCRSPLLFTCFASLPPRLPMMGTDHSRVTEAGNEEGRETEGEGGGAGGRDDGSGWVCVWGGGLSCVLDRRLESWRQNQWHRWHNCVVLSRRGQWESRDVPASAPGSSWSTLRRGAPVSASQGTTRGSCALYVWLMPSSLAEKGINEAFKVPLTLSW